MTRATIFVDTCCWIAILNKKDALSGKARDSLRKAKNEGAKLVTSEMVFVELLNMFADFGETWRQKVAEFVDDMYERQDTIVVEQNHESFIEALKYYIKFTDKKWSLTDCASFVVMGRSGITEALTDDHHFEQAGFVCLMK
jgi:uncharacterized protein